MPKKPSPLEKEVKEKEKRVEAFKEELKYEQETRNYCQLERDRIQNYWEITKQEIDDMKSQLRNKKRIKEEMEERHQVEMKVYKQKLRHLLYEQKRGLDRLKIENENGLKMESDDFRIRQIQLKQDQRSLKRARKEKQLSHQQLLKDVRMEMDKNNTELLEDYERRVKEMHLKYDTIVKELREQLDKERSEEKERIENDKNMHIKQLMEEHKKEFEDIKNYYKNITDNNLALIKSLKKDVARMKKKEARNEKLMFLIAQENKKLSEPFTKTLDEVKKLRKDLATVEQDKLALKNVNERMKILEKELQDLSWEHEVVQQRFQQVENERDELYDNFEKAIQEVNLKSGYQNLLLEKKLETIRYTIEKKQAQLSAIAQQSAPDDPSMQDGSTYMDKIMNQKDNQIKSLRETLDSIGKRHKEMVNNFKNKLHEYDIPEDELGFTPAEPEPTQNS